MSTLLDSFYDLITNHGPAALTARLAERDEDDEAAAAALDSIGASPALSPIEEQFHPFESPTWTAPAEETDPEPSPADTGERLTMEQLIRREVERFLAWDNDLGMLLGSTLGVLADEVRFLSAQSVDEYYDHRGIVESCPEPN